ncbi:MAG: penicillin acylase family protein [Methylococcaceae bacterium]|nr:penicillin acylase family protein [Methylococcaceae bacterium]
MMGKLIKRGLAVLLGLVIGLAGWAAYRVIGSAPPLDGELEVRGLADGVTVEADELGVPNIQAKRREDALAALGLLHARDRLFQLELMRRKSGGRLAEVFGAPALSLDRMQRGYRFEAAARAIVAALPESQRKALDAYVAGINGWLDLGRPLPPEFAALGVEPEPWRPEDSILVALGMFQTLNSQEQDERMLTVMEAALPPELVRFLTPDTDAYATVLVGGENSRRPATDIPVDAWVKLGSPAPVVAGGVDALNSVAGSNNWAVSGARSRDGRAMVANDMHLSLGIPNIWYRAQWRYGSVSVAGLTLPGLPLLITGSNGHVAWGYTNVDADVLDLVQLDVDREHPNRYRAPDGWKEFEHYAEIIKVKDGEDELLPVRSTQWGPVSPVHLLGKPVAVRWTALDAGAVDLGLLDLMETTSLEDTMAVLNRSGGPNQNVALADERGRIGWTVMGRFPLRRGLDGVVSRAWGNGAAGWDGFIPPAELPRLLDPPQGYLATANNRTLGADYPHVIAHNQANGYRAYRISQRLKELPQASEADLLALQMDTQSAFFEFYRELAVNAAGPSSEVGRYLTAWNGRMDGDSVGIPLLWIFRDKLAEAVFSPVVRRGRQLDPQFGYYWREMETPLRALLTAKLPKTLPSSNFSDWDQLIKRLLDESVAELRRSFPETNLDQITWGQFNKTLIQHPFSRKLPALSRWLDMPAVENGGCSGFCVRIIGRDHGATERMVVSPNHPEDGILHMPGGQSGHPLSDNYRDQQGAWHDGNALPFLSGKPVHRLLLRPL